MRRLFQIGVVTLLLVGNWGAVLSASFCTHARGHACCQAKVPAHEHAPAHAHDGMAMDGGEGMSARSADGEDARAFDQPAESCAHCAGHSGPPPAPFVASGAQTPLARDLNARAPEATWPPNPAAASFAPPITSRQHGPPEAST